MVAVDGRKSLRIGVELMRILLSVAIIALSFVPAMAQDAHDWSGLYGSLFAGFGSGSTEHVNPPGRTGDLDIDGALGGAAIGFDFQNGDWVAGVVADIAASSIDGSHGPALFNPGPNSFNCGTGPCITKVNWISTIRGRVGFATGRLLPYLTGGLAIAGVDATIPNDPTLTAGDRTETGWTAGGGLDVAIDENWSAGGQILYTDIDDWRYDNDGSVFTADARFTTFTFVVTYRH
jgi:outer membrane immunogenic protein